MASNVAVGIIVVSYGHEKELRKLVPAVQEQLKSIDKLVIVDNHPKQETAQYFKAGKQMTVLSRDNKGFAAACNEAAQAVVDKVDLLILLNPDAIPGEGMIDAIRGMDQDMYAGGMPVVLLPDNTINSAGNVVHTTGLSWCDKYMDDRSVAQTITDVSVLSGACLVITSRWWKKLGGMDEDYFMYYEDTDLSTRILQAGGRLTLLHNTCCTHDYSFEKGSYKWLYLERNITLYIIKNWPGPVIVLFLPQLILSGMGRWVLAFLQGRGGLKIRSAVMSARALPLFIKKRRLTRKQNTLSSYDFLRTLHGDFDSPILHPVLRNKLANSLSRIYYRCCLMLLRPISPRAKPYR